jgi:hypothetical protein
MLQLGAWLLTLLPCNISCRHSSNLRLTSQQRSRHRCKPNHKKGRQSVSVMRACTYADHPPCVQTLYVVLAAPYASANRLSSVSVVKDPYDACDGAHAICVLTEWDEFKHLDFPRLYARCENMLCRILSHACSSRRGNTLC